MLDQLPGSALERVGARLGHRDLARLPLVCRRWAAWDAAGGLDGCWAALLPLDFIVVRDGGDAGEDGQQGGAAGSALQLAQLPSLVGGIPAALLREKPKLWRCNYFDVSLLHLQMRPGRARAGGGPAERDWRYCLREGSGARKATGHPLEGHPSVDAEKRWAAPELCFRGLGWNRADFSHPDVLASLDECGVGHLLFVEAPPGVQWHRRFPGLGPPRLMEGQATWPQLRAGLEGGEALSAARFAQGSWKAKYRILYRVWVHGFQAQGWGIRKHRQAIIAQNRQWLQAAVEGELKEVGATLRELRAAYDDVEGRRAALDAAGGAFAAEYSAFVGGQAADARDRMAWQAELERDNHALGRSSNDLLVAQVAIATLKAKVERLIAQALESIDHFRTYLTFVDIAPPGPVYMAEEVEMRQALAQLGI